MKKIILSLLALIAFTACEKDVFKMSYEDAVQNSYNAVFKQVFGEPAENQDWGFGSRTLPSSFGMTTRAADPKGNEWESNGYVVPTAITDAEREAVLAVFNKKGDASYTSLVDWDCFFVQQVYKGVATYKNHDNQTVTGSEHMDWICTVTNKHVNVVSWWPYEEEVVIGESYDDHINNFNNGNCSAWDGKMLMVNTDSHKFGFKSSEDNGHVFYNFRMEKINDNYYVGFDFEANGQNKNEQVDRDYIYNDWIVKIVPGKGVTPPERYTVRIICEDLSAYGGSDFDFNDVVFDASYTEGSNTTTVTILAAGGTIPLYVDGREVHELFAEANPTLGITVGTMINTNGADCVNGLEPVTFEIDHIVAPWDITIAVMKQNTLVPLKAEVGSPASKIAVDPTFVWCNERNDIRNIYPDFVNYVQDTSVNWY